LASYLTNQSDTIIKSIDKGEEIQVVSFAMAEIESRKSSPTRQEESILTLEERVENVALQ
jgi:nucleoid DNA-binding protein